MVEALQGQMKLVSDELGALRAEIIQMKSAHAQLHQQSVDYSTNTAQNLSEAADRVGAIEKRMENIAKTAGTTGGLGPKPLIEAKQVTVEKFGGSVADSRSKFLTWAEHIKDRTQLYNQAVVDAMDQAAQKDTVITEEVSDALVVGPQENRQLHGFLKDRTDNTANMLIRNNKGGLGLESWRLLWRNFNPQTIFGVHIPYQSQL